MKKHPSNKVTKTKVFHDDNYEIYYKKEPNPNIPLELLAIAIRALEQVKGQFTPQNWNDGMKFFAEEINKQIIPSTKLVMPKSKIITP